MKVPDGMVRPSERVNVRRTLRLNETAKISHGAVWTNSSFPLPRESDRKAVTGRTRV